MLRYFNFILILLFYNTSFSQENIIQKANNYISTDYSELLFVSIENQKMYHIKEGAIVKKYIISSSEYGTGSEAGSNKTPLGLHKVKEKYGDETPINGRMIGRVFYGQIATLYNDTTKSKTDDVTSRIFWLEGLENGKNKGEGIDSYKRYIYIHGTSEEGRLGTPASHGCIRMKNNEVIDLYKTIAIGTLVLIL
ncbi:MAG: L,D-transpeptidase [Flavobacteriales bacterium]|nr:L,D-transpeptidase [Flavobacteriales bacterium]